MRIQIINGPNLNLLGTREPGIYGSRSFADYLQALSTRYPDVQIDYYQSNIEGELIDKMQHCILDHYVNASARKHNIIGVHLRKNKIIMGNNISDLHLGHK